MKTIVIGGGNIAYFTARALLAGGHQVSIIVRSEEEARRFSRSLDKAVVIHGDGTSIQLLEDAGAMSADSFLAITPHDEDNLIGCQIATGKFGIQNTMAVINDPDNVEAFRRLGITSLLSTTDLISSIIEKKNSFSSVIQILPLGDGSIMTVEIALTEKSPANGQALRDVKLQEGVLIVAIERSGELIIPRGETVLHSSDRLTVLCREGNYATTVRTLSEV